MKLYAVKNGRMPGIYSTWDECKMQVDKFPGAQYKSFNNRPDAEAYLGITSSEPVCEQDCIPESYDAVAYTDGSYNIDTFVSGYGYVLFVRDHEMITDYGIEPDPEACHMRNVAGEILGATKAVDKAVALGAKKILIRHDYIGLYHWVAGTWQTNNRFTAAYKQHMTTSPAVIDFEHIKAHTGDTWNEKADDLAKTAVGIKE